MRGVDWEGVKRRLAEAQRSAAEIEHPPPEKQRTILEARARQLSRAALAPLARSETIEVITFEVGDERWAIETRFVREVAKLELLVPVPGVTEAIVGITSHRGEMLALVDLRRLYGLPSRALNDLSRVIVAGDGYPELGLLADRITEIATFPRSSVLEAPGTLSPLARTHVLGVTPDAVIVLDGAALLQDPRLFVDQSEET